MSLLEAHGLIKHLGGTRVVDEVSLRLEPGQVLGLLGPNGAGKTTTIRMLYGFLRPDGGRITFQGQDLGGSITRAKRSIGVCTQEDTSDTDFSVRQNLMMSAGYFRPRVEDLAARVEHLLDRFELRPFADHRPEHLSGGYRRRLMIARALIHSPTVLFLDEPTTGLDPQARMALWELIHELRADGMGIVLTTHYMDEAERLADRMVVLRKGRVMSDDSPRRVLGALVGEHVVVLPVDAVDGCLRSWLTDSRLTLDAPILGEYHLALSAVQLTAFTARCGELPFEIRKPTLDDLFVHLARDDAA